MNRIRHPQKLPDRLGEPDAVPLSFLALFDGWVEDLERFHASATAHAADWELVVIDNPTDDADSERIAALERVVHIPLRDRVGYGAGRNVALRLATGRIVCVVDTSVEIAGPLRLGALDGADVGLVGRWGVVTQNGFDYEPSEGPDVHGVEGYFMAMRRSDVRRIGVFDPKFRFYRHADIDYSFRVRDAGLRTIVDVSLPLVRHTHRLWENTADRDELSRKNFFRLRDHWADRPDLLTQG